MQHKEGKIGMNQVNDSAYRTPFEIAASFLDKVPVNLDDMAAALGATVSYDPFMSSSISGHIKRGESGYEIAVNAQDSSVRQRFTLAHEIAHLLLHRDKLDGGLLEDDRMYRSSLSTPEERAANIWAARLLMPEPLVRSEAQATGVPDSAGLAAVFGVSKQAMEIRLRELRIA